MFLPNVFRRTRYLHAILVGALVASCMPAGDATSRDSAEATPTRASITSMYDTITVDDFGARLPTDSISAVRVVSLNPTATEIIFALGQQRRLVGRSAWDEFPAEVTQIPSAGNGIRPNIEAVLALRPTLVVLYATGENREAADAFARAGVRTISIRVDRIEQFAYLTRVLATALGAEVEGRTMVDSVTATLDSVRAVVAGAARTTVVWPVWRSPVMVVGGGSYLDELIEIAGATNVFGDSPSPSPQVTIEEIAKRNPHLLLAGFTGADEFQRTPAWNAVTAVREDRIRLIDSKLTGRPSVNLGMAAVALARAMHPELSSRLP